MKRSIVSVALLVFAVWPAAQYALTVHYDTDPWKLFGWAMYCVPGPMKSVRIWQVRNDGTYERVRMRTYTPAEQHAVDTYRERRRALGRLAGSEDLAKDLLRFHPDWEGVIVAVMTLELDRGSAHVRANIWKDTHWRDGRDEPFLFDGMPQPAPGGS